MTDSPNERAVSVVVPLYNEAENVPILQAELTSALGDLDYEIIFVDDGSTDATVAAIAATPRIRVLQFAKNAGQSAAMYAGLHAAHGRVAVLIDGDLQNDPADIPKLLARLSAALISSAAIARCAKTRR
jgi:dolichol-phosphate mannosyltransferase